MKYYPFEDIRDKLTDAIVAVLPELRWAPFENGPEFGPHDILDPRSVGPFVAWRAEHLWRLLREVWSGEFKVHYIESPASMFGVSVKGFNASSEDRVILAMIGAIIALSETPNDMLTELGYRFFDYIAIAKIEAGEQRLLKNEQESSTTYRLGSNGPEQLIEEENEDDGRDKLHSFIASIVSGMPDRLSLMESCPLTALINAPVDVRYKDEVGFINFDAAIKVEGRPILAIDAKFDDLQSEYFLDKTTILSDNQIRYYEVRLQKVHGRYEIVRSDSLKQIIQSTVVDYRKAL